MVIATSHELAETTESSSAVSWPAVFAGAFITAAVALMLLALGAGVGFCVRLAMAWHRRIGRNFHNRHGGLADRCSMALGRDWRLCHRSASNSMGRSTFRRSDLS